SGKAARLPERRPYRPPRLLFRPKRDGFREAENRRQSLRHADDADRRPLRLRNRHHGGPGRMGERGWREACERGGRQRRQYYALTSRFVPVPAAALASGAKFCCAASISLTTEAPLSWFIR